MNTSLFDIIRHKAAVWIVFQNHCWEPEHPEQLDEVKKAWLVVDHCFEELHKL